MDKRLLQIRACQVIFPVSRFAVSRAWNAHFATLNDNSRPVQVCKMVFMGGFNHHGRRGQGGLSHFFDPGLAVVPNVGLFFGCQENVILPCWLAHHEIFWMWGIFWSASAVDIVP